MESQSNLYTTWGREFGIALDGICECTGQDAYEVLCMTFKRPLSLQEFHEITTADLLRMRDCANAWFETDRIEATHVRKAVEMVCWHWPLEKS